MSVNIKLQKYHLNMNPAFSARLCVNEWHRRTVSFTTHTEVRVTLAVFPASAASIYEHMNIISTIYKLQSESHLMSGHVRSCQIFAWYIFSGYGMIKTRFNLKLVTFCFKKMYWNYTSHLMSHCTYLITFLRSLLPGLGGGAWDPRRGG